MSSIAAATSLERPRSRSADGPWRWVVLGFVGALLATLWAFTRLPMAGSLHGWASQRCVVHEMQASDWPCRLTLERASGLYLAASVLVTLAPLVPALVLAIRGRRVLAFVPLVAPLGGTAVSHLATWAWSGNWVPLRATSAPVVFLGPWETWSAGSEPTSVLRPNDPIAIGIDLLLLGAGVAAVILLARPGRAPRSRLSPRAWLLAAALAVGASAIVQLGTTALIHADPYLHGGWFVQGLVIVAYGLLLPLEPRRPLWTIPLVGCLLSLGAPAAIAGRISDDGQLVTFAPFRGAVPLALMGFAAAAAAAFVSRQRGVAAAEAARPTIARRRPIGARAVAYGVSLAVLTGGTIAAALDPLPYAISSALPTYLGARERVVDLRTRLTLDEALEAAARYHARHGSFGGFDARSGRAGAPRLLWADGYPDADATFGPEIVVRVTAATDARVELVAVGPETTYCISRGAGGATRYGAVDAGRPRTRALAASAVCERTAWTRQLLRPFPIERLCDGAPEIVICRATQQRLRAILASPTTIA